MKFPTVVIGLVAGAFAFLLAGLASNINKTMRAPTEPAVQTQNK